MSASTPLSAFHSPLQPAESASQPQLQKPMSPIETIPTIQIPSSNGLQDQPLSPPSSDVDSQSKVLPPDSRPIAREIVRTPDLPMSNAPSKAPTQSPISRAGSNSADSNANFSKASSVDVSERKTLVPVTPNPESQRGPTPDNDTVSRVSGSPMSVDTPYLNRSAKRTASGVVKPSSSAFASPAGVNGKRSSVLSELSSDLKTRLSYAMVKVQHGWERQSLSDLERLTPTASATASPAHTARLSPPTSSYAALNSSPRRPLTYSPNAQNVSFPSTAPAAYQSHASPNGRGLAPAANFDSHYVRHAKRRSLSTRAPPDLRSTHMSSPMTPQRQGMLRMPSQQAEKDVVDALIFMSSPNNSANMKHRSENDWPAATSAPRTVETGSR